MNARKLATKNEGKNTQQTANHRKLTTAKDGMNGPEIFMDYNMCVFVCERVTGFLIGFD